MVFPYLAYSTAVEVRREVGRETRERKEEGEKKIKKGKILICESRKEVKIQKQDEKEMKEKGSIQWKKQEACSTYLKSVIDVRDDNSFSVADIGSSRILLQIAK